MRFYEFKMGRDADGRWFVDVDAPDDTARLQGVVKRLTAKADRYALFIRSHAWGASPGGGPCRDLPVKAGLDASKAGLDWPEIDDA